MAKQKRRVIGSVIKPRETDTGGDYIKIREDVVLKKNQILRLESKAGQLENLKRVVAEGKISSELGKQIEERLNKIPAFVRFEIIAVEKE